MVIEPAAMAFGGDKPCQDLMSRLQRLTDLVPRIDTIGIAPDYGVSSASGCDKLRSRYSQCPDS